MCYSSGIAHVRNVRHNGIAHVRNQMIAQLRDGLIAHVRNQTIPVSIIKAGLRTCAMPLCFAFHGIINTWIAHMRDPVMLRIPFSLTLAADHSRTCAIVIQELHWL